MKKIIYLIISLFIFIPICILADDNIIVIRAYNAKVKNSNGAPIYIINDKKNIFEKNGEILKYGTEVKVDIEEDYICINEECEKYVKTIDLVPVDRNYNIPEDELSKEYDAIAITDLEIKRGPASTYESTGVTIKAGTKFKARDLGYINEETKEFSKEDWNPYIYVNYNGTKGFVLSYEGTVGLNGSQKSCIVNVDMPFIDPKTGKTIDTIKANTIINTMIYMSDDWEALYYFEYNGKFGAVNILYFLIENKNIEFNVIDNLNIYYSLYMNDSGKFVGNVIGSVPKGSKFISKFYDIQESYIMVYYENNDTKGWIYADKDELDEQDNHYVGLSFELPKDNVIEKQNNDNNGTIPPAKNSKFNSTYLFVCVTLLILLTIVVIVVFVNRKNKVKNE